MPKLLQIINRLKADHGMTTGLAVAVARVAVTGTLPVEKVKEFRIADYTSAINAGILEETFFNGQWCFKLKNDGIIEGL